MVVAAVERVDLADFEAAAARARIGLRGAYTWSDEELLGKYSDIPCSQMLVHRVQVVSEKKVAA